MLVPEASGAGAQVIDVDDLAEFIVAIGAQRWTGVANTISDSLPLADLLALAADVAGHTGDVVVAPDAWLLEHDVAHWAGLRSLPLWLPGDMPGFATRANTAYRLLGGNIRPLRVTLERTLADERERGLDRDRTTGLTRDDELALIDERLRRNAR